MNPRVGYGTTSAYTSRYNPHLTYPADCHWNCKDLNRAGCYWRLWTSAHGVGETFAGRYGDPWTASASTGWHAEGISWDTDAFIVWRRGTLPARELRQILWDANEYREAGYTREICTWDDEGNPSGSTLRKPNKRQRIPYDEASTIAMWIAGDPDDEVVSVASIAGSEVASSDGLTQTMS